MEFFAICAPGLEPLLAEELEGLDAKSVVCGDGSVGFEGSLTEGYRACLWSRLALRIVCRLARGPVDGQASLAALVEGIPWEEHALPGSGIEVFTSGSAPHLTKSLTVSRQVREAIASRLLDRAGALPPEGAAQALRVQVHLSASADRGGEALVGVDLSGEPLAKRGYEQLQKRGLPTLRADLAAAALILAGWPERVEAAAGSSPGLAILFSGGATLVGEAASMARDVAPGLLRAAGSWGFELWAKHSPGSWSALLRGASRRREAAREAPLALACADPRPGSRDLPRAVLRSMGMTDAVRQLSSRDLSKAGAALKSSGAGDACAIADLSWTSAASGSDAIVAEAALASFCLGFQDGQDGLVIARKGQALPLADDARREGAEASLGRDALELAPFAPLSLRGAKVEMAGGPELALEARTASFCHALAASTARATEAAREEDVSCFRVYDRDLPDYPFAIDLYRGAAKTPGRWLVIGAFEASGLSGDEARSFHRRLLDVASAAPELLDIAWGDVQVKLRHRAKGGSQYASGARSQERFRGRPHRILGAELPRGSALVEEGGLLFEVDLASHLDTGVFLDTRDVRARIRELAKRTTGRRSFLNLFSYTGTATCYAADGGCAQTTTVDLSGPYLDVARRNLVRNGFLEPAALDPEAKVGAPHRFVRADAMAWIAEQRRRHAHWDLIYCDPPTFSNSASMRRSFDVQRDHLDLLIGISRLLAPGGIAVFCCNLSTFEPDFERLGRAGVELEDITAQTIPFDFRDDPPPHHCYLLRRAGTAHGRPREGSDALPTAH